MTNVNLTELEKKVLKQIRNELSCGWEDENGDYTQCWNPFYKTTKPEIKGALGSLVKKGIICIYDCESKNDCISVEKSEYLELV